MPTCKSAKMACNVACQCWILLEVISKVLYDLAGRVLYRSKTAISFGGVDFLKALQGAPTMRDEDIWSSACW